DCDWLTAPDLRWNAARMPAFPINSPMPVSSAPGKPRVNEIVTFEVKVEADGQISDVCFMGPVRNDLYEAVTAALKQWRFRPARIDNAAVPSAAHYEVRFRACCEQAVLYYPPRPAVTDAQAQQMAKTIAQSPCPGYPGLMPGATPPKPIYHPEPQYTDPSRKDKLSGVVVLLVKIGAEGRVEDACVTRSLSTDLDESAVRTIKTWRFEPAQKNGVAIATVTSVEVSFSMH